MSHLGPLAQRHIAAARTADNGRSVELVVHDGPLRQTVIALVAGTDLAEHNAPPAASIQVLMGRVVVTHGEPDELTTGQLAVLTHERHAVKAVEDSVFLLTTVTSVPQSADGPQRAR